MHPCMYVCIYVTLQLRISAHLNVCICAIIATDRIAHRPKSGTVLTERVRENMKEI